MVDPKGLNRFANWGKHHLSHLKLFVMQFGPHIHFYVMLTCVAMAEIYRNVFNDFSTI